MAAAASTARVFMSACMACHAAGIAGAPRVGDAGAWGERIAQGNETLYTNAIQGRRAKRVSCLPRVATCRSLMMKSGSSSHMVAQSQ